MSDKQPTLDEQIALGIQAMASTGINMDDLGDCTQSLAEILSEMDRLHWEAYLDKYKHLFEDDHSER